MADTPNTPKASGKGGILCRCGLKFHPKKSWQRFCSRECRDADWKYNNMRVNPRKEESIDHLIALIRNARANSALFMAIKSEVYRKVQKKSRTR